LVPACSLTDSPPPDLQADSGAWPRPIGAVWWMSREAQSWYPAQSQGLRVASVTAAPDAGSISDATMGPGRTLPEVAPAGARSVPAAGPAPSDTGAFRPLVPLTANDPLVRDRPVLVRVVPHLRKRSLETVAQSTCHKRQTGESEGPLVKIGYARVSTAEQSLDRQADELRPAGCDRLFQEMASGRRGANRPEWQACLDHLRAGDTLRSSNCRGSAATLAILAASSMTRTTRAPACAS